MAVVLKLLALRWQMAKLCKFFEVFLAVARNFLLLESALAESSLDWLEVIHAENC